MNTMTIEQVEGGYIVTRNGNRHVVTSWRKRYTLVHMFGPPREHIEQPNQ